MNYNENYTNKPISPWGYFGLQMLFSIPIIGFIILIIMALGGTDNINKKNFARSFFCPFVVAFFAMFIIFTIVIIISLFNYAISFNF